ncbi:MAG: 30S ribosomal protein S8 [Candidatus Pacearchaeota archaeon]|jgi:small subunit ribosomal protein S8
MSQDKVSDALNQIMNIKKAKKNSIILTRPPKLLKNVLEIVKDSGYIEYTLNGDEIKIDLKKLNELKTIKPRYTVTVDKIDHYVRRYLPAKDFGFLIISTNQGLMKHYEAQEKNLGGCLIAYVY